MGSIIAEKSFVFAVKVVKEVRKLKKETQEYEMLNQLMRSATSIGANATEAEFAQSTRDYVSKFNIALKEANETRYWLRLVNATEILPKDEFEDLLRDVEELIRILVSIVKTTREKNNL